MTGLDVIAAGLRHRQVLVVSCLLKFVSAAATLHQHVPSGTPTSALASPYYGRPME